MPLKLTGSCRCGKVRFSVDSHAPVPFMLCYCSICRKTAGGGGYAINLHADKRTLRVEGETAVYHAVLDDEQGGCRVSTGERHFCAACASALWVFSPEYPELVHPFASAIDTKLPKAPSRVHMMLSSKANWIEPEIGPHDQCFDEYSDNALEDWHRARGLWIDYSIAPISGSRLSALSMRQQRVRPSSVTRGRSPGAQAWARRFATSSGRQAMFSDPVVWRLAPR